MRAVGLKFVGAIVPGSFALTASGADSAEPLVSDSSLKEFSVKQGELQVAAFLAVTNVSLSEVVINQVLTSCSYTVASLPFRPRHIAECGAPASQPLGAFARVSSRNSG